MINFHDSQEFLDVLPFLEAKVSKCSDEVRSTAPVVANQIAAFGLPPSYADWYAPVTEVSSWPSAFGRTYECDGQVKKIGRACIIGTNTFGDIVIDVDSGCVVDLDRSSGESQLINTSFPAFLYFVGRMKKSSLSGYQDAASLFADFSKTDPIPMKNYEGFGRSQPLKQKKACIRMDVFALASATASERGKAAMWVCSGIVDFGIHRDADRQLVG